MKFSNVLESFLANRRRGEPPARVRARPRSLKSYTSDLTFLFDFMKKRKGYSEWNQITRNDMREFIDWATNETGWAPSSRYKMLRSLRALFMWIEVDDDCREAGMKGFRKQLGPIPRSDYRVYVPPTSDVQKFASAWNTNTRSGLRNYTMLMLVAGTGMRSGEMRYLKLNDLKLDEKIVMVPDEGKTGHRVVWITNDLATDLRRWLRKRSEFANCEYVFVTDEGNPIDEFLLPNVFCLARQRTGIKKISPHTMRHYFCTNWIKRGGDLIKLKSMTGHKRLETLEIYVHLANDASVGKELERIAIHKEIKKNHRVGRPRTQIA